MDPSKDRNFKVFLSAISRKESINYVGIIDVGTPEQTLVTAFDTIGCESWLNCESCLAGDHEIGSFNFHNSTTFEGSGKVDTLFRNAHARDDLLECFVASDRLSLSGTCCVPKMRFLCIDYDLYSETKSFPSEARIGLGHDRASFQNNQTYAELDLGIENYLEALIKTGSIDDGMFCVWLSSDTTTTPAGEISFGAIDCDRYEGEITWISVEPESWEFPVEISLVAKDSGKIISSLETRAKLDISNEWTRGPGRDVVDLNLAMDLAGPRRCKLEELPNLVFAINGIGFPLEAKDFVERNEDGDHWSTLQSHKLDVFHIGTQFMRSYYTIFHRSENRIGFARSRSC